MTTLEFIEFLGATATALAIAFVVLYSRVDARMRVGEARVAGALSQLGTDREGIFRRILSLEGTFGGEVPRWARSQDGTFLAVSPAFVRLFCLPVGYAGADVVGKKLAQLDRFGPDLQRVLREMDLEVVRRGCAARCGVEVGGGVHATVIKFCQNNIVSNDIVFLAYAVPEEGEGPRGGRT